MHTNHQIANLVVGDVFVVDNSNTGRDGSQACGVFVATAAKRHCVIPLGEKLIYIGKQDDLYLFLHKGTLVYVLPSAFVCIITLEQYTYRQQVLTSLK